MRLITLTSEDDFEGWRTAARSLVLANIPPQEIIWQVGSTPTDLFATADQSTTAWSPTFSVPRPFLDLARDAILHSDPQRFALLYTLLFRLRETPRLIDDQADPLVQHLEAMAKSVCRDIHKMRAFLRFRELPEGETTRFVAWFEPEHHIVRANAGFFVRRFANMRWSILTPLLSIHWDGETLTESPGATKADAPDGDPVEQVWGTYYASTFNPARVKIGAMLKEMPRKYWANMPETALIPGMVAGAQAREQAMVATARKGMGGNSRVAIERLREEAASCTRCHLYKCATQTVFGEGPSDARLMLIGEQPGDQEDIAGRPFVGPAGQVLDRALAEAGIDRARIYVSNAVKHFKFQQRGKRRLHQKPDGPEIQACRWWLDQERLLIRAQVTVALGATAARALLGKVVTITATRGHPIPLEDGGEAWVTIHPSYLLRIVEKADSDREYRRFVEDLARVRERVET
jgi:DNA polymerase